MHETDFEHSHEELYAIATEIEGLERLDLVSVGIDVGSSTSHLAFSRLTLRKEAAAFSTRYRVAERELIFSSPVLLTPYTTATRIDFDALRGFIEQSYAVAGLTPEDIDTGAVVITGEALAKENAQPIADYFAQSGGAFVCVSAGPHHEAILAAHGSGAVALSRDTGRRVLNVDIGGGTTKLSLIDRGEILQTAALHIGARLIAFDDAGHVIRLEQAGQVLAREAGLTLALGDTIKQSQKKLLASLMADSLAGVIRGAPSAFAQTLFLTEPMRPERIDHLVLSGGAAEYLHQPQTPSFGDLGPELGLALGAFIGGLPPGMIRPPTESLRATVIGAAAYTVQVSGSTNFPLDPALLPLRGRKVVPATYRGGSFAPALAAALAAFDLAAWQPGLVLAIKIETEIDYAALRAIAEGIAALVGRHETPVLVAVDQDIGQTLGAVLKEDLKLPGPLLVIDGIQVGALDHVDIGRPFGAAGLYPVTVKSLVFG